MAFYVAKNKTDGLAQLKELVTAFEKDIKSFTSPSYNETQLRTDFLDAFLMCFGWDVYNESHKSQLFRDVLLEESIEIDEDSAKKNPDYTIRLNGIRKFFFEAKKPSVDILTSSKAAFQTRQYGWSGTLGISILTNFANIVVYDCRYKPETSEEAHVARVRTYNYTQYVDAFDDLYDLISFDSVASGKLDSEFSIYDRIGDTFDSYFLEQIEKWRKKLALSAVQRNENLKNEDINFLVQRLLNRIVFLRICEDRAIEKYETLKGIKNYDELKELFNQSDNRYNSGLFNFIEDKLSLTIEIDTETLISIFSELYYPHSPYNFAVVDPSILSQIYEKFLGSQVVLSEGRQLSIVEEPEVAASNGVVPTPKMIVEQIVKETLLPLVDSKSLKQLKELRIADICCGSGTFLISVYDFLLNSIIEESKSSKSLDPELIYEISQNTMALTLKAKRSILQKNIFGVDINPYATEVTQFSLLLKLLEGENATTVDHFINLNGEKALPDLSHNIKCGNSLVDNSFFEFDPKAIDNNDLLFKVKPFNWGSEYPFLHETGGFDAIVGNPPYVRIQNLIKYAPQEAKYYQSDLSGFLVAKKETFDKYYLFIQKAVGLLKTNGFLGYVVPHKFFIAKGGKALRYFINTSCSISRIIHFGVTQIFPDKSTYTAILVLVKNEKNSFEFRRIKQLTPENLSSDTTYQVYEKERFNQDPWIFLSKETEVIFNKLKSGKVKELHTIAEICVGLQTSKDEVYIFTPEEETENAFVFLVDGVKQEIEKNICVPCIYDLSLRLFDTILPNAQMIFPYTIDDGKAQVIGEEYFKANYPNCWSYLNKYKDVLSARSINGSKDPKWYQFGRSQSLTKFHNSPKLIWNVLSTKPTYVYDELNIQFTGGGNGPYYSLINNSDYSIFYIMGILSHPLFENMVKAGASEFRGAYYSHGKQFIEKVPIRVIDEGNIPDVNLHDKIVKTVKGLIETKHQYNGAYGVRIALLQRKLDVLNSTLIETVNELYGISMDEFNIVINDEMFTKELIIED